MKGMAKRKRKDACAMAEIIKRDAMSHKSESGRKPVDSIQAGREGSNRNGLERESDNMEKEGVVDHRETKTICSI